MYFIGFKVKQGIAIDVTTGRRQLVQSVEPTSTVGSMYAHVVASSDGRTVAVSYTHLDTQRDGIRFIASLDAPSSKLHDRKIPTVTVHEEPSEMTATGTNITIYGCNNNRRERFTHSRLRDQIFWFTKFGSVERQFDMETLPDVKLHLKGLDRDDFGT